MWQHIRDRIFGFPYWLRWLEAQIPTAVPWFLALQRIVAFFCIPLLSVLFVLGKLIEHGDFSQATVLSIASVMLVGFLLFIGIPAFFAAVLGTLALSSAITRRAARSTQTALFVLANYAVVALCAFSVTELVSFAGRLFQHLPGVA